MFWLFVAALIGLHDHGHAAPLTTRSRFTVDLVYTIQEGLLEVRIALLMFSVAKKIL